MAIGKLTRQASILSAVDEFDRLGREAFLRKYGFGKARRYFLVRDGKQYDSKAITGAAYGYEFPAEGPLKAADYSGGDVTVRKKLESFGFEVISIEDTGRTPKFESSIPLLSTADREREERRRMWAALLEAGGPKGIAPQLLRGLRIYGGAQGIWVDKARTGNLADNGCGVAVAVLHTGSSYADELSDDAVLYHYPKTARIHGRDQSEIEATKQAARFGLPIFVITYPSPGSSVRDVTLGWVEGWDDSGETFLIGFGETPVSLTVEPADEEEFHLTETRKMGRRASAARPGQQRFKFRVLKRYGHACAICDLNVPEILEAAHIRPKQNRGSDDPRNGLVLCPTHHRAFDAGFFTIEPKSLKVVYLSDGPNAQDLSVQRNDLAHLPNTPHLEALEWRWKKWP